MDKAGEVIIALYLGHSVNMDELDWQTKIKIMRLRITANYIGFRLMTLMERIKDVEFFGILASSFEDCDDLVLDAINYGLEENMTRLMSCLQAASIFCWYKSVPPRPFLALCPDLLDRLDEIQIYLEAVEPDNRFVSLEETKMEKQYIANMPAIDDFQD